MRTMFVIVLLLYHVLNVYYYYFTTVMFTCQMFPVRNHQTNRNTIIIIVVISLGRIAKHKHSVITMLSHYLVKLDII